MIKANGHRGEGQKERKFADYKEARVPSLMSYRINIPIGRSCLSTPFVLTSVKSGVSVCFFFNIDVSLIRLVFLARSLPPPPPLHLVALNEACRPLFSFLNLVVPLFLLLLLSFYVTAIARGQELP